MEAGTSIDALFRPLIGVARKQRQLLDEMYFRPPQEPSWATKSHIIKRADAYTLRRFEGEPQPGSRYPVLVVPPEVNSSTIVDFGPGQSLVATILNAGFEQVCAIDWASATAETSRRDIDDSVQAIIDCAEELGGRVHLLGVCQGGWESAIAAALRPDLTASLTLAAAPLDFAAGQGIVNQLARTVPMSFFDGLVAAGGGVARGDFISLGFDSLRPFERFVLKPIQVWNRLNDREWMRRFHQLNDWYRCPKNISGTLYLRAVRELFKENRLVRGTFECLGQKVDLQRIVCPLCLIAGSRDHITPASQVFAARDAMSSEQVLEVSTAGGHIGSFMGRKELRQNWPTVLEWLRMAEPIP